MANISVTPTATSFNVILGEDTVRAAASAAAAAASAATALGAVTDVETASETALSAIEASGDGQLAAIAVAGANSIAVTTDNTLGLHYEVIGNQLQAVLGSNVGVYQFGLITGTHLQAGDDVAAMRWSWGCASDTTIVEIKVYERNVAGATGAGTLNNAAPIATHDTLIRTFTTTPAVLGVTVGNTVATVTEIFAFPTPFTVREGYDYIFQFRNLNGSAALVNCAFNYAAQVAGSQRRAGFSALTANPTSFSNLNSNQTPIVGVFGRRVPLAQAETAADLAEAVYRRDEQVLSEMNARNAANLLAASAIWRNNVSLTASFWGDSLVEDSTGGIPVEYRAVTIAGDLTDGTVNNYGVGGNTASQITTRVSAATAGEKAGFNFVMMGANDAPASKTAAAIMTDYATCASAFTNASYLFAATWHNTMRPRDRDVWRSLRSTYGAKALDMVQVWARYGNGASDVSVARLGQPATGLLVDGLHNSRVGCVIKGREWAAALVARNGGPPYVHDDIIGFKQGDAAGTSVLSVRALGEALNFTIAAGNEDGAVEINRTTGAITRTADPIIEPYREVFVEAENHRGKGRNGRIVIVQQMDGSNPQSAVQVVGNGASVMQVPSTYAPADPTQMTVVLCVRLDPRRASGSIIGQGGSGILTQNLGQLRMIPRTAGGGVLGDLTVSCPSPSDFHFYFFSIDTVAGLYRAAVDETTFSATPSAGNIGLASYNLLFGTSGAPWIGGIKMLAIYNAYYNVHDSAVRAAFYDSTTLLPKDIGDGTASGTFVAPQIYLRGMKGDYLLGKNFGVGGDLHVPPPLGRRQLGFQDIVL